MIEGQKISGFVLVSDGYWGCYPWVESISSFLPVVDELVVVYNYYGRKDGTLEKLRELQKSNSKIRLIPCVFDIEKYGWTVYGVARNMGYYACTGDVVLMFDADGVLHENEENLLQRELGDFIRNRNATGYWEKNRIYKPTQFYSQHKHSGIYSKKILGDRLSFMRSDGKGAPNFDELTPPEQASKKFSVTLFGYEHVWDTKEVLEYKVNRYGVMISKQHGEQVKTKEEYFEAYMRELVESMKIKGRYMELSRHPASMQEKVNSINETHFGYDYFGFK